MTQVVLQYLLLGAGAGVIAGLLGVGGGLIIVPALAFLFQQQGLAPALIMHMAIATSLATIVATSVSSVYAHHRRGAVLWPAFWRLTPGIVAGAWFGAGAATYVDSATLRIGFGVFELLVAAQMWFALRPAPQRALPGALGMGLAGGGIGFFSALVGVGGGTLTVPFLTWCNRSMHQAVATSAACGLAIAIAGGAAYITAGRHAAALPAYSWGYVYGPAFAGIALASVASAPLGARLAHALPTQALKKVFAVFLSLLAIWMLWA